MQVWFNSDVVTECKLAQFLRMPVVYHDRLAVIGQAQSGQQGTRDASATQKNDGMLL